MFLSLKVIIIISLFNYFNNVSSYIIKINSYFFSHILKSLVKEDDRCQYKEDAIENRYPYFFFIFCIFAFVVTICHPIYKPDHRKP